MSKIIISRREFVKAVAVAVNATVLVACSPVPASLEEGNLTGEPSTGKQSPQVTTAGRVLKVLVVYDSVYGNTAKIAQSLLDGLDARHESSISIVQEAGIADLEGIDLLLVGSPTHGGTFTEPVKNFLGAIPDQELKGIQAAAFDTSFSKETQGTVADIVIGIFGFAAPKIAAELESKGASVLSAERFIVLDTEGPLLEGEIDRAARWAADLVVTASNS